jgi:hypothetical protein
MTSWGHRYARPLLVLAAIGLALVIAGSLVTAARRARGAMGEPDGR